MNFFKKAVAIFLFTIILCSCFLVAANAAGNNVRIDEMKMTLTLPDGMLSATRDDSKNNLYYSTFSLKQKEEQESFREENIYMQGKMPDASFSLTVTMTSDSNTKEIVNYEYLSASELETIKEVQLENEMYKSGTVGEHGDFIFLDFILESEDEGTTIFAASSNTVVNGMNITYTFNFSNGQITESNLQTIKQILSSVKFDAIAVKDGESPADTAMTWFLIIFFCCCALIAGFFVYRRYVIRSKPKRKVLYEEDIQSAEENGGLSSFFEGSGISDVNSKKSNGARHSAKKKSRRFEDYDAFSDIDDFEDEPKKTKKRKNIFRR